MTGRRWRVPLFGLAAAVAAVWVGSASLPGEPQGCPDVCASGKARTPGPLRVISLNVLHGFPTFARLSERLDLVADEIRRRDADIALLQEVPWAPGIGSGAERLATQTGMNHLFARANGNRFAIGFEEGSAILSRFPLRAVSSVELLPMAGPLEHRIALAATADTPWGPIRLVVTHLAGASVDVNRRQAASLGAWLPARPEPMIIGGDFNATPDSATYAALPAAWLDAYRSVHPGSPGLTCCVDPLEAEPRAAMRERIDYLFTLDGTAVGPITLFSAEVIAAEPVRAGDGWLRASDHAGLLVELAWDDRPAGGQS